MALNIKLHNGFVLKENRLEHHRNPSGFNNKVNYLLVESGRNLYALDKLKEDICLICTWPEAFDIAREIILNNYTGSISKYREMREEKQEYLLLGLESKTTINKDISQRSRTRHIVDGISIDKKKRKIKLYWMRFLGNDSEQKRKRGAKTLSYEEFSKFLVDSLNSFVKDTRKISRQDLIEILKTDVERMTEEK